MICSNTSAGRVGLVGLPWTLLTQVLLPLGGPLADLFLVYLVAVGDFGLALLILALAAALETTMIAVAVLVEKEDRRLLLWAPFLRLVWRPLQLLAVVRSVRSWAHGDNEGWRTIERYNTVNVPGGPSSGQGHGHGQPGHERAAEDRGQDPGDGSGPGLGQADDPMAARQPRKVPVPAIGGRAVPRQQCL